MIATTSTVRDLEGRWIDDGYGFMEVAVESGWKACASWGRDGWDLGDWPYVVVLFRTTDDTFERSVYVEGDIEIRSYDSREEMIADTNTLAAFYWRAHGEEWIADYPEGSELPEYLCGPFEWKRLDSETA